jgi:hypothetical protein
MVWVLADCEKHAEMCQAFGVEGYPTLVLLKLTKTAEGEMAYQYVPYKVLQETSMHREAFLCFVFTNCIYTRC